MGLLRRLLAWIVCQTGLHTAAEGRAVYDPAQRTIAVPCAHCRAIIEYRLISRRS